MAILIFAALLIILGRGQYSYSLIAEVQPNCLGPLVMVIHFTFALKYVLYEIYQEILPVQITCNYVRKNVFKTEKKNCIIAAGQSALKSKQASFLVTNYKNVCRYYNWVMQ